MGNRLRAWATNRRAVAVAFALVTIVKLVAFGGLASRGVARPFVGDNAQEHFLPIAERLLREGRFNDASSRPDSKVPPAYPLMNAAAIATGVSRPLVLVVAAQMVLDLLTALCVYAIGGMLACPLAGALAGLAWLVYPPAVVLSTWIAQETPFTAFLMLSAALVLRGVTAERGGLLWTFGAGLAMAVAVMFRATPLFIAPFLLPLWVWKRRWKEPAAFVLAMALVIAPWAARNRRVLGDDILVATGSGTPFVLGAADEEVHHPDRKPAYFAWTVRLAGQEGMPKPTSGLEGEIDRWQFRTGVRIYEKRLRERPASFLPLAARKFLALWYSTDVAGSRTRFVLGAFSLLVVPLAAWRLWRWRVVNRAAFLLVGGVVGYFVALHVVMLPLARYMVPVFPLMLLAAGDALAPSRERALGAEEAPRAA